jgi:uncharacterized protein (TIGR02453 family)
MLPAMATQAHFDRTLFKFLSDLETNNDRDWFKANKTGYERALKQPALAFIEDFGPRLQTLSDHFVADPRPVGGSLFRIHRDTRFSKDKTPYKTSVGIHFRHESAKDAHAPGYYLHLGNEGCFLALGLWTPETAVANTIRQAIVSDDKAFTRAIGGKSFGAAFSLEGEKLKRPPRGFDKDHPLIEDLKRKSFIASKKLTKKQVMSAGLSKEVSAAFKIGSPLMKFLCKALDVPF